MGETTIRSKRAITKRPSPPAPAWRGTLVLVAKVLGLTAATVAVAVGLFYARLVHGPVSLGFLIAPIEHAIAQEVSGFGVQIGNVSARLNDHHQLEFELTSVRIADASNTPLALAPSATFSISRRALLAGRIAPESVDLISPRLLLYYGDDGKLSLQFSPPADVAEADAHKSTAHDRQTAAPPSPPVDSGSLGRIDIVKVLTDASASARRREYASAYLREVGLRSATVIIDNGTRKSIWRVPELDVDLDHRRSRSSIAGRATIESLAGPWTVNFRTLESEKAKTLQLAISVQNLVPRGLARTLPHLAALESIDVPIWAEAQIDLSNEGDIRAGKIGIDAAPGTIVLPWLASTPFAIDGGHVEIAYNGDKRRFDVAPSALVWGDSRMQFAGSVVYTTQGPNGPAWAFELQSKGGWIGAEPPLHDRLVIDDWGARGLFTPERGHIVLSQLFLRAGGAEVTAEGDITNMIGAMAARLEGKIGPMPVRTFKALWPSAIAPQTRAWISRRLVRGQLQSGSFKLTSGNEVPDRPGVPASKPDHASLTLVGTDLGFAVDDGWPALELPRALAHLDGHQFELTAPDGALVAPDGRRIAVKGTFTVDMLQPMPRTAHISARGQGPLSLALQMLDQEPFHVLQGTGIAAPAIDGKIDAQLLIALPLGHRLQLGDVQVEGKARITDGRVPQAFPPYDLHGTNIALDLSSTAVEARGDMLIKGVPVKASWQHIYGVPVEKQPPLTITTSLDAADRTQLGLDINDIVQGDVAVEVTVSRDARNERRTHVRADLANAEVGLDSIAWKKPKGRASTFQFDVVKGTGTYPLELQNVQLVGDNVAIEGWMGVGPDHRVREYRFPNFSINVITSLEAHGKMRSDGVWDVTAKGPRYDGRDLFQSFFDVAGMSEKNGKARSGLDLRAEIDTVVGYNDSTMRNVRVTLQKRGDKLTSLDVRGSMEGNKPFAAVLRHEPGQPRLLRADSTDAGQIFKLVGFYSNAVGGGMNLEVNLDGSGVAQRTGTLWAKNFVLLGDAVGGEVLVQTSDGAVRPIGSGAKRGVVREQFQFDTLRVPFSVGHGQFLLNEARIEGPVLSANMRGKIDFRSHVVNVGGTFTPLAGLNTMFRSLPLFGPLLTGPRGDGVFAMTFAIQGPMNAPQIIVNPLSMVTPGVTREIMQMTPENPRIVPREKPATRSEPRASSTPASTAATGGGFDPGVQPEIGGSWSAEPNQPPATKKR